MSPMAWVLWSVFAVVALVPMVWAWRMAIYFIRRRAGHPDYPAAQLPKAAIILALRGADPSLKVCLRRLFSQNYPNYSVRIVVDHQHDPAWDLVQQVLSEPRTEPLPDVRVDLLREPRTTCSLKMSSQLQALEELEADVQAIAFVDADAYPSADWLREMIIPLNDADVGVSTGVRWYAPPDDSWGGLVRHLYNAGAYPQMLQFYVPWGGSMALRRDTLERGNLLDHWATCFCEDTSAYGPLSDLGLHIAYVPTAAQFNRESTTLPDSLRFIHRQLMCVCLHNWLWKWLVFCNFANAIALNVAVGTAIAAALMGKFAAAAAFGGVVAVYLVGMFTALIACEWVLRHSMRSRLPSLPPYPKPWRLLPAICLTQSYSMRCMLKCLVTDEVDWRGVTYTIHGKQDIRLVEYRPFVRPADVLQESQSVL